MSDNVHDNMEKGRKKTFLKNTMSLKWENNCVYASFSFTEQKHKVQESQNVM